MTTTGKVLTGFIVGATTGALIGVLFAPKKGVKTRTILADKSREVADNISQGYNKAKKALGLAEKADKALEMN